MSKTHVSANERLQLIGLLTLAARHNSALKDIVEAARAITGENDDMGHTSDAVYSDYDADQLLDRLDITVDAATPPEARAPQQEEE